ncbi:MFS transporter [Aliifodinibius salipaludis]|uniref:MFS transporter n=1 Tax=Fodinibius salipaludis TaxID=2032627 RepID=UPI0020D1A139|nr:MFS transporter [Aliifodinibius salipaludis]
MGRAFSVSPAISSLAISGGTAGMAAGLFAFAFWADRWPRKKLMSACMFGTALFTIVSAGSPNFAALVIVNFIKGMTIAGISAVALAYLAEEVDSNALGFIISIYLSGNIVGGMSGRVGVGFLNGWLGWRYTTFIVGIIGIVLAVAFLWTLPKSEYFQSQKIQVGYKFRQMQLFLRRPILLAMFLIVALLMGVFVSTYNYLNFRLEGPPFSMPHYIIALVYVMYIAGIGGSMAAGRWSDLYTPATTLKALIMTVIVGLLMLLSTNIWVFVAGLGVLTFGFFGAHTTASRIVSVSVRSGKSTATSLYWLFYYVGSSIIGTVSGVFLSAWSWNGFIIGLLILGLFCLLILVIVHKRYS